MPTQSEIRWRGGSMRNAILVRRASGWSFWAQLVMCLVIVGWGPTAPAQAETYTVTKTADTSGVCSPTDCSLREAVFASNVSAVEVDTIVLPPSGTPYTLTLGKIEITRDVIIEGSGPGVSVIDASGQTDKIFDIDFYEEVVISGLTLHGGTAPVGGGASSVGGAIFNAGDLTMTNVHVTGNHATYRGGGIYNDTSRLHLTNCFVSGNTADAEGGGIMGGYVTLINSFVFNNTAGTDGGGIWAGSTTPPLTIIDSTVSGNSAAGGDGGGIYTGGVRLVRSKITGTNVASGNGGGLYIVGSSSIEDSTIELNQAGGHGGGLDVANQWADVDILYSTFSGNQAGLSGGAINNIGGGVVTITNSTLSGNTATDFGGAIHVNGVAAPATITLVNSTLANNTGVGLASGVFSWDACFVNFHNTLVSDDCFHFGSSITSTGGNIESPGNTCILNHATDQTLVTPIALNLDSNLQLNGGLTANHALLLGSVAINQGTTPGVSADQRHLVRDDGVADVGAYEANASVPDVIFGDGFETGDILAWSP